jgi:hypothetical protein
MLAGQGEDDAYVRFAWRRPGPVLPFHSLQQWKANISASQSVSHLKWVIEKLTPGGGALP